MRPPCISTICLADGEPEAGPALGLGVGIVDLVELLEDAVQLLGRYPWTRVSHGNSEVAVHGRRGDAHFAGVGELDGVADEVEEHLGETLLVAEADRQLLGNVGLERELLGLSQRLGRRTHRLNHGLDRVLAEVQAELAGLDLGDVEHGVDEPQQVLAVGADAGEGIHRFLGRGSVEAFLHQFGVAEDGGERGPQLVAHVGDELRLVLARDLELAALLDNLIEQARVLDGDDGLVGEGFEQLDLLLLKILHMQTPEQQTAYGFILTHQGHGERRPVTEALGDLATERVFVPSSRQITDMNRLLIEDCATGDPVSVNRPP